MASLNLQLKDGCSDGSRSPARTQGVSAPWSKIVTGESSESSSPAVSVSFPAVSPSPSSILEQIMNASTDWCPPDTASSVDESGTGYQPEGSESDSGGGGGGSNAIKKPVWSKPSNGVVEAVSPVMGAVCWPALGESTKAAPKSSSSESIHTLSDGSLLPTLEVTANSASSSHKPATVNPTSTPNHVTNSGQRSMKRGGASSGAYSSSKGAVLKPDTDATDSISKGSPRGAFRSQTNSYKRANGGPYSRGQGQGQVHGQGRGNHEWNQQRNYNHNMQSQRGGYRRGGYIRPSTPFMHPAMRPFGNNIMYPDVASGMVYYQGPVPPMVPGHRFFPFPDPLHGTIVKQIEYYFSNENLVRDTYLRRNMDENGWVSVNLIAGFNKVSCLTDNVQLILDVMRQSTIVEVQGDKMRRRNDWMRWLMPPTVEDSLTSQFQGVRLDGRSASGGGERAAVA